MAPGGELIEAPVDYAGSKVLGANGVYPKLFHALLGRGVALAPGAYEVLFVSMAHTDEVLSRVLDAAHVAARGGWWAWLTSRATKAPGRRCCAPARCAWGKPRPAFPVRPPRAPPRRGSHDLPGRGSSRRLAGAGFGDRGRLGAPPTRGDRARRLARRRLQPDHHPRLRDLRRGPR